KITKDLNIPIDIISGNKEARLTFYGALGSRAASEGEAVIDVGGGSTELIIFSNRQLAEVSANVGSVRLTDLFVSGHPIRREELVQAQGFADKHFAEAIAK